jgi:hypothetical protein
MPTDIEIARITDKLLAESRNETRSKELAQAQGSIEWAINATSTGEARNALTLVNIFLTHAQDVLAGRPTPTSLGDLAQQVATERYDAAMQRTATFRRIHEEGGVILLDNADTEQPRNEEARKQTPPTRAASQTYPLQGIDCPTHGPQTVLIGSHEQRGTTYSDGSFDTRWHEQAGCGCHFDVWYYRVHPVSRTANSVTIVHNPI